MAKSIILIISFMSGTIFVIFLLFQGRISLEENSKYIQVFVEKKYKSEHPRTYNWTELNRDELLKSHPPEYKSYSIYSLQKIENTQSKFRCKISVFPSRNNIYNLFQRWIEFSTEHNITWHITYGTLLGSLRSEDMNPWDSDADIHLLIDHKDFLSNEAKGIKFSIRPGDHCPFNGLRRDCNGNIVTNLIDRCSFCGPYARIFLEDERRRTYIDIYLFEIKTTDSGMKYVFDEGLQEYTYEVKLRNYKNYFPYGYCTFLDLKMPCPNRPMEVLREVYGPNPMKPISLCDQEKEDYVYT